MKNKFILFSFIFAFNLHSATDSIYQPKWAFSISGGVNIATMYGTGIENLENEYDVLPRAAGNFNLHLAYFPLKYLAVESGFGVNGKGYHSSIDKTINTIPVTYHSYTKNGFFEIPLCLKPVYTSVIERMKIYAIAGFSYARAFKAKEVIKAHLSFQYLDTTITLSEYDYMNKGVPFPIDTFGNNQYIPYKEIYNLNDLSIVLGAGFEKFLHSSNNTIGIFLDLRYYHGLIDNINITPEGERLLKQAFDKLYDFCLRNNIDPNEMGFGQNNASSEKSVFKFATFSISAGLRFYF